MLRSVRSMLDPRTQIRGLIEAASSAACGSATASDPRTQIRGLIEAASAPAFSSPSSSDPRTQIRGLIEAGTKSLRVDTRWRPIRGLRSAASLKLAGVPRLEVTDEIDPRTQIRGLIEAGLFWSGWFMARVRSADSDPRPH